MSKKPKVLYLYREDEDGRRERWAFTLDDRMTILSETRVEEASTNLPGVRTAMVDGQQRVTQVEPRTQRAYQFFIQDSPCWFDGCEDLRQAYEQEVADLGEGCSTCKKGDLIRKYLPQVLESDW